jgi:hypothetical protein
MKSLLWAAAVYTYAGITLVTTNVGKCLLPSDEMREYMRTVIGMTEGRVE